MKDDHLAIVWRAGVGHAIFFSRCSRTAGYSFSGADEKFVKIFREVTIYSTLNTV